jgi:DNA-binding Lrp family transcriptional regulator
MTMTTTKPKRESEWTFFTNHTHVLVFLSARGDAPLREVAEAIGITERAVQRIVLELERVGVLVRQRVGRRNHYSLKVDQPLRHPLERHCTIGQVLEAVLRDYPEPEAQAG